MISDWELWACANECIRQHGADAAIFAAMRADALMQSGDDEGARTWRAIVTRIAKLLEPPSHALN